MANYTISGTALYPDGVTPRRGIWSIGIHTDSGVTFEGDDSWRGGPLERKVEDDGTLSWSMPETDETFLYEATFYPSDLSEGTLGPFTFDLTEDRTWQSIITTPTMVPVTPPLVTLAQAAATAASASAAAAVAVGTTNDTVMASRTNDDASAFRAALTRNGKKPVGRDELMFNVRDYGATGDGTTNDTTNCQAAITACQTAGGGIVYFPPGTYYINTLYVTASKVHVRGAGQSATTLKRRTISTSGQDARVLAFNSTGATNTAAAGAYLTDVSATDLTIDGNNANVYGTVASTTILGSLFFGVCKRVLARNVYVLNPRESGINVFGCIEATVDNCTVDGIYGDFMVNSINVQGDWYTGSPGYTVNQYPSKHVVVRNCRVFRAWAKTGDTAAGGSFSICVIASDGVTVTGCLVDNTGEPAARGRNGRGITFEGGGEGSGAYQMGRNYVASNNRIVYCKSGIAAVTSAGSLDPAQDNLTNYSFTGNVVQDSLDGIVMNGRHGVAQGNTIEATVGVVIGANRASVEGNFTITGNVFRAISLASTLTSGMTMNKVTSGGYIDGLVITGNVIDGSAAVAGAAPTQNSGMFLTGDLRNFTVSHNTIRKVGTHGIALYTNNASYHASNGRIIGNEVVDCCQAATGTFPFVYGIFSSGTDNVVCALNRITGGTIMSAAIASLNTGAMTIFGNMGASGATATDASSASLRIGGTVTGSRGGNAAVASLLTGLASAQIVKDSSTA